MTDFLLWGTRVIVPDKFHATVLDELHDTHPGIVRMKSLSRSYVWWPGLDPDIKRTVYNCSLCQTLEKKSPVAPFTPMGPPSCGLGSNRSEDAPDFHRC